MRKLYKNDIISRKKPYDIFKNPTVYFLIDNDVIVYVGFSNCINRRLSSHVNDKIFDSYFSIKFDTEKLALDNEKYYIEKFKPKYNNQHNSDFINKKINPIVLPNLPKTTYICQPTNLTKKIVNNSFTIVSGDYLFKVNELFYIGKKGFDIYSIDNYLYEKPIGFIGTLLKL